MRRVLLIALLALLATAPAAEAATRCGARSTAVRCLAKLRGAESLAVLPSGTVPRTAALQAFAASFGRLPGVRVRRGATGALFDTTPVLAAVRAQRRHLTRAQRRAVDRRLARVRRRGARAAKAIPPDAPAAWKALVDASRVQIEAVYGRKLTLPITVALATKPGGTAFAQADFVKVGTQRTCRIDVFPKAWGSAGEQPGTVPGAFIAAHETFHCFQFDARTGNDQPPWLAEGSANWVAGMVVAGAGASVAGWPTVAGHWSDWLTKPGTPLFSRDYSAIGFFSQLEASGVDVWAALRQMLKTNDSEDSYAAAGQLHLDTWGSGYYRDPSYGPGWDLAGPSITAAKPAIATQSVADGETRVVTAAPRSAALRELGLTADVVEVDRTNAFGRLRDPNGFEVGIADRAYCARQDRCEDAPASCPDLPIIGQGQASLAIAADAKPASVKVRGRSLADFCKSAKPGKAPASSTSMTVTGAASNTIVRDGACNTQPSNTGNLQMFFIQAYPGSDSVDQLTLTLKWQGPGTYDVPPSHVTYVVPDGPAFESYRYWTGAYDAQGYQVLASSWRVDVTEASASRISGTIDATLKPPNAEQPLVTVKGTWACHP